MVLAKVLIALSLLSAVTCELQVAYEWNFVEFDWTDSNGLGKNYDPSAVVLYDVDVSKDGRVFVTAVRDKGVPATVMTVTKKMGSTGYRLAPYPDWSWYRPGRCDGLVNVYRVAMDDHWVMWVVDTGRIGSRKVCPSKLVAFDLYRNKPLRMADIPEEFTKNGKALEVTAVVDNRNKNFYKIYIADTEGYGLIVYDLFDETFKRVENVYLHNDKNASTITIMDQSFDIQDGILGMALSQMDSSGDKSLYFTALASYRLNVAKVSSLTSNGPPDISVLIPNLPSQSAAMAISSPQSDGSQILIFSSLKDTALVCYNDKTDPSPDSIGIIAQNSSLLQFPSGMKIHRYGGRDYIKLLTNRYQKVATGTLNFNETNFRILKGYVDELVAGTICAVPSG